MDQSSETPFWEKKLSELNREEWEALCDGCGICCLHKFQDEDSGRILYTDVACRMLDPDTCRCRCYAARKKEVPDCLVITLADESLFPLLPKSCAYRLRFEGKPLQQWHPLISGDAKSVIEAGICVLGKVVSEDDVEMDALEERIAFEE